MFNHFGGNIFERRAEIFMETIKVEGVILNTTNFGNSNRVVTIYTKELGKLDVNAYSCRRSRNPLSGAIQMFNHICAEISQGAHVDTIRDADVINFFPNLTADIDRLSYASIFFEVVNKMTLPKICEVDVYNLLIQSLPLLDKKNPQVAALISITKFMELTGFQLNFESCVRCGKKILGASSLCLDEGGAVCESCTHGAIKGYSYPEKLRATFKNFLSYDLQTTTETEFSLRQIQAAEKILFQYVQNILGQELRSINFLRQLQA